MSPAGRGARADRAGAVTRTSRVLAAALVAVLLALWPAQAQGRPRIDWWKVVGASLLGIGGGFVVVGVGHQIAGRLASGQLYADDAAGNLDQAMRLQAERHVRSLDNGALVGYGIGAGLLIAGTLVLVLRPTRPSARGPALPGPTPTSGSALLAPRPAAIQSYGPGSLNSVLETPAVMQSPEEKRHEESAVLAR
jgi:hypothetical protein